MEWTVAGLSLAFEGGDVGVGLAWASFKASRGQRAAMCSGTSWHVTFLDAHCERAAELNLGTSGVRRACDARCNQLISSVSRILNWGANRLSRHRIKHYYLACTKSSQTSSTSQATPRRALPTQPQPPLQAVLLSCPPLSSRSRRSVQRHPPHPRYVLSHRPTRRSISVRTRR